MEYKSNKGTCGYEYMQRVRSKGIITFVYSLSLELQLIDLVLNEGRDLLFFNKTKETYHSLIAYPRFNTVPEEV